MHFFGKIELDKFGTHDGRGVEISGSAVWFLSLSKSRFKSESWALTFMVI